MKRFFYLLIFLILVSLGAEAQSPGGVNANLTLWFKADAGVNSAIGGSAATDGSNASQWMNLATGAIMTDVNNTGRDNGGAAGGAGTTTAPKFYNTTENKLVNYNPSVYFNGTNSFGLYNYNSKYSLSTTGTATGFHFFSVGRDEAINPTDFRATMSNGIAGNNPAFDISRDGASPNGWNPYTECTGEWNGGGATMYNSGGIGAGVIGNFPTGYDAALKNKQPQIYGASVTGVTPGCSAVMDYWIDGYKRTTSTPLTGSPTVTKTASTVGINGKQFFIGSSSDAPWRGPVTEVIGYSDKLSDTDAQKINTYLAIKYGVTLGQGANTASTPGNFIIGHNGLNYDYIATDGTPVWSSAKGAGYDYNIAGIGRDDIEGLSQKQSMSVNYNAIGQVTIGLDTVAHSNVENKSTFNNDKNYLVWGDNGASSSFSVLFSNGGTSLNNRMARVWKVQNTGNVGTVTVAWPGKDSSISIITNANDPTFSGGNTIKPLINTITINGIVYSYTTLTLANDSYFTFAAFVQAPKTSQAPGGVNANLTLWFKADAGVNSAIGGSAATDGSNASQWMNQATGAIMTDVNNTGRDNGGAAGGAGTTTAPKYYNTTANKLVNYNPSVYFNGTNSFGLYNYNSKYSLSTTGTATGFHFFSVGRDEAINPTDFRATIGNGSAGNNPAFDISRDGASPNGWNPYTECTGEWNGGGATMYNSGGIGAGVIGNFPVGYAAALQNKQPQIYGAGVAGVTPGCSAVMDYWIDGYKRTTNTPLTGSPAVTKTASAAGINSKQFFVGSSTDAPWRGPVTEVIGYSDKLSDIDAQKVNTYLAIIDN